MRIHFIGIGGIGVSSLAQYYLAKGHTVSGSDLAFSEVTDLMKQKGATIALGNKAEYVEEGTDLVVYSPAVKKDNPEYKRAKELGIKLQSYPEALGDLTHQYDTVAISGSHGKSTTTAMIGLLLEKAGLDPTVIVGTKLKEFGNSNFRMGESNLLVIEACEYDDSFANYQPKIIVVTNVDKEHLDYFKTFKNVILAFKKFIVKLPADGFLVANKDDKNLVKISKGKFTTKYYSLKSRSRQVVGRGSSIKSGQKDQAKIKKIMKIPGQHNVSNALAVLEVARILGVDDKVSFESISNYKGSWRRFEVKEGSADGKKITVVSDYAHHPNEVAVTLQSAREKFPKKKIWLIYQPHQYQRTHYLFNDFVRVFRKNPIDDIIIIDIYDVAGREVKKISSTVSSESLVKKIAKKHVQHMHISDAEKFVKDNCKAGDVVIIMGAGDVYKLFDKF